MNPLDWHRAAFERILAARDRLPHALLISGARGIGKLICARAVAQALLCEEPGGGREPCGACTACRWFEAGTHPDFRQVEPGSANADAEEGDKKSSAISVQQIRELSDLITMSSHRGGPKVVLVHPAETMNVNAANALLKNLEEPPADTYFLLVTNRPHLLLPTIKSRCQQIALAVPDAAAARAWLAENGIRHPDVALANAGGAPLLAQSLDDGEYWGARAAFFRQLTARDFDALAAADAVTDFATTHVIEWLQKWSYDLVLYRAAGQVRYNPDYREALESVAARVDPLAAARFHREMVQQQRFAQHPLNPKLLVEHLLLAYSDLLSANAPVSA